MEWDNSDLKGGVMMAFSYMEKRDEIVGAIYGSPQIMKEIVLAMPDEVHFDYIPEGFGILRTAYLKFKPVSRSNELRFINQEKTVELRLILN